MKKLILLLSILLITSCAVQTGPENTYVINSIPCTKNYCHSTHLTLLVLPVETSAIYNTSQMAYTNKPYKIAYFAKNGWAQSPGLMLQPLIVQTLQNTHFFHAVTTTPTQYDFALQTQLLELRQDFLTCPSVVRMQLRAQLLEASTNRVIATKQFCAVEPAPCQNPYGGVIAANRANQEILSQLAYFCVNTLSGH